MAPDEQGQNQRDARAEAAAERAKAAARDSARWLGDEAQRLYTGYNQQSKYFKWRTWIAVVYLGLGLVSVVMALPRMNSINAYVKVDYDYERRLLIYVRNDSAEEWTGVKLLLDDQYEFAKVSMRPNESLSQNVTTFVAKGTHTPAKGDLRPKELVVDTDDGSFRYALTEE